jgi:hypothetical protein
MRRKTFDTLVSAAGLLMAFVLVAAGGLLTWGYTFVNGQVHDQLAAQKIFFPPANSAAVQGPQFAAMRQYGGQQLTTGAQAETYANHFIAVHLTEVAGGKTYSEVSAAAQADPTNAALQGQVNTLFKGATLRGLLLNAYAFGKMGQLALIAGLGAFGAAALMLILSLFGIRHARRVPETVELLGSRTPARVEV